jgi:hypothetical protein
MEQFFSDAPTEQVRGILIQSRIRTGQRSLPLGRAISTPATVFFLEYNNFNSSFSQHRRRNLKMQIMESKCLREHIFAAWNEKTIKMQIMQRF